MDVSKFIFHDRVISLTPMFLSGSMPFTSSALPGHVQDMLMKLREFMKENVYPNEAIFQEHQQSDDCWKPHPLMEQLKVLHHKLIKTRGGSIGAFQSRDRSNV